MKKNDCNIKIKNIGAQFVEMQLIVMCKFITEKGLMDEFEAFANNEMKKALEEYRSQAKKEALDKINDKSKEVK